MDLEALLKRIKCGNVPRKPTLEMLRELCAGFASNIPFDTLDMFGSERKVWHLPKIYNTIVIKKRGGFCYEVNALLQWSLKELGYKVELLKTYRYYSELNDVRGCSDHMALMVTLENGDKWLTDVAFGRLGFTMPLRMQLGVEQPQANGIYRLRKTGEQIVVERKRQIYSKDEDAIVEFPNDSVEKLITASDGNVTTDWRIIYQFEEKPHELEEFQKDFERTQDENSFLTTNSLVVLQNGRQKKVFINNLLFKKEFENPDTIKLTQLKICSKKEMHVFLKKEFGLEIDFQLKIPYVKKH